MRFPSLLLFLLPVLATIASGSPVVDVFPEEGKLQLMIHMGHTGEVIPYDLPPYAQRGVKRSDEPFDIVFADVDADTKQGWDDQTFGEVRRNCFIAAVEFIYDRVAPVANHPTWRIFVNNATDLAGNYLATAGSTSIAYGNGHSYVNFEAFGLNCVQVLLQQGVDVFPLTVFHTNINWDFGYNWFIPDQCGVQVNEAGGDTPGSNTDFFSVAVHELTHALGFLSKVAYGTAATTPYNPAGANSANQTYVPAYSNAVLFPANNRYDVDMLEGTSSLFAQGSAAIFANEYVGSQAAAQSNNLYNTGFYQHQLAGRYFAIDSRSSYAPQSSISHWADTDVPYLVMNAEIQQNVLRRYWGLGEGGMIKDLKYINARAVNDECDAAHLVVFGSYSLNPSFNPTPSAAPTASTCGPFHSDVWYVFVPYFVFSQTNLAYTFSAPNGLAIYQLCTNTTNSTQLACSSNSSSVSLQFSTTSTQVYIRVNIDINNPGSLVVGISGEYNSSNVFPARASNHLDAVAEMNQFQIPATHDPFTFNFVPRISGYYSLYTVSTDESTVISYNGQSYTANYQNGAISLNFTANSAVSIQITSSSAGTTGHLRIYEPVHASCYRSMPVFRLGRYSFEAKYLPPLVQAICTEPVYRTAWLAFVAPLDGYYIFSSCGSTANTIVALTEIPCANDRSNPAFGTCPTQSCGVGAQTTILMAQGKKVFVVVAMIDSINNVDDLVILNLDISFSLDSSAAICSAMTTTGPGVLDSPIAQFTIDGNIRYYNGAPWVWKRFTPCPGFNGSIWSSSYNITSIKIKYQWRNGPTTISYAVYLDPTYGGFPMNNYEKMTLLRADSYTFPAGGASGTRTLVIPLSPDIAWTEPGDIWLGVSSVDPNATAGVLLGGNYSLMSFWGSLASSTADPIANAAMPWGILFSPLMNLDVVAAFVPAEPSSTRTSSSTTSTTMVTPTTTIAASSTSSSKPTSLPLTSPISTVASEHTSVASTHESTSPSSTTQLSRTTKQSSTTPFQTHTTDALASTTSDATQSSTMSHESQHQGDNRDLAGLAALAVIPIAIVAGLLIWWFVFKHD